MRLFGLTISALCVAVCVVGCSSGSAVSESVTDSFRSDEELRCDALRYVDVCIEQGMPSRYGMAWGCHTMYVPVGHGPVVLRHCVDGGYVDGVAFKCCE